MSPQPMDKHLGGHELIDEQQRGAKAGYTGTVDSLLIDRMFTLDCHRNKRGLSMAWIDERKAYDLVDYGWLLRKIMRVHRFLDCMCEVVSKLCTCWNARVVANTRSGFERPEPIRFDEGLP